MIQINNMALQAMVNDNLLPEAAHALFLGTSDSLIKKIVNGFEQIVIELLSSGEHLNTAEQRTQFVTNYNQQRVKDTLTLSTYADRRKQVIEKLSDTEDVGDVEYTKETIKANKPKKLDFNISTNGGA